MRWRTISIYIPDGNARSIKICDIKDSIVKAIFIPRTKLSEAAERKELQDPWIYFLFGEQNEIGKHQVYIWEAETLITRLKQHNSWKDFWNAAICFVSEKRNINKAHIKYLENYCCEQAKKINKCELENSTTPTQSSLTEQDVDFVMSFFDDMKVLISALGFPIFEEIKKEKKNIFYCKWKWAIAEGELNEDWITIFKWSQANIEETATAWERVIWMRRKLIEKGILKKEWDFYIFTEDYTFSSPSASAAVILARRANWWTEWKDSENKTMDEKIRKNWNTWTTTK